MAKEVAISKRIKISQAQQYMILAVLGASLIVGVCLAVTFHFINLIEFNARVIVAKDQAIVAYSDTIKNVGVCKKPRGEVYSQEELKACHPGSIEIEEVPGTLRNKIMNDLAANPSINRVEKSDESECISEDGVQYTYEQLDEMYSKADNEDDMKKATDLIKKCSALRVIPDALPAHENQEALLASLNKIFKISNWEPEAISPSGSEVNVVENLNSIAVNLSVETDDAEVAYRVLNNMERSIREFDVQSAKIEARGGGLNLAAQATAYWVSPSELQEVQKVVKVDPNEKGTKK